MNNAAAVACACFRTPTRKFDVPRVTKFTPAKRVGASSTRQNQRFPQRAQIPRLRRLRDGGIVMAQRTPPPRISANRGAGLFGEPAPEAKPVAWRANIDGGSRGNPGPASYGVVICDPRGGIVARLKK